METVKVRSRADRRCLQLFYVDPLTKRDVTKSAGTDDPAQAEREAARWEEQLAKSGRLGGRLSIDAFMVRFTDEYLVGRGKKTGKGYKTALRHLRSALSGETLLTDIDAEVLSRVQAKWRAKKMADTSIITHVRHLNVAFRWAASIKLIREVPTFSVPRMPKRRLQRGRALSDKEHRAMLAAVPEVCGVHAAQYERLIRGLWLSGLRLSEAVALSWDMPPIQVDLDGGKYPRLIIHAEGQKARRDEIIPLTPEFSAFLRRTPAKQRTGRVFPLPIRKLDKIGKLISAAGKRAGIVVNAKGKFASAHDLRSSFGMRWKTRVHPLMLKTLMRHATLDTTMKYYIDDDADEVAAELWKCTADCTEKAGSNGHSRNGTARNHREKRRLTIG